MLPDPLASAGFWNIGAWALPAAMLSVCSAAVFATVFVSVQLGGTDQGFVLPLPWTAIIGTAGAVLGWVIVVVCRRRPGRLWPRIWALGLACANSFIAILAVTVRESLWSSALAVAGFSAAVALAPRLARLRPDSPMVQRIAPLSLLILLIVVPSSCALRRALAGHTQEKVYRGSLHAAPESSPMAGLRRGKG